MSITFGTWLAGADVSLRDEFTIGLGWMVGGVRLSTRCNSVGFERSGVKAWAQLARRQSTRPKRMRTTPFSLMYALHIIITKQRCVV
jgi:hypothetical protein